MGPATGARDFFFRAGEICPQQYNPADFYIHKLAIVPGKEIECRERVEKICKQFDQSDESKALQRAVSQATQTMDNIIVVIFFFFFFKLNFHCYIPKMFFFPFRVQQL